MRSIRKRNVAVFCIVATIWLILDQLTKAYFNAFTEGKVVGGPYAGIFEFELVKNTGGAWGIFGSSTFVLAIISLIVCAIIVLYLFFWTPNSSVLTCISLALVFAGGIGNAIDRLSLNYVIDFISPVFIDFPVFNIADIGVTCGGILFLTSLCIYTFKDAGSKDERDASGKADM